MPVLWGKKMAKRKNTDFRPDSQGGSWLKSFYMTRLQRLHLMKWSLYAASILLALVLQDVIMSRFPILGATTDLPVCVILLLTVMENCEVGSLFVLITSLLYYFSGSAPGPYVVGLMTFIGVAACMLRQMYLHRSRSAIVLCAGAAMIAYELGVFGVGVFLGLTHWGRMVSFLLTGLYSAGLMIPLYPLFYKIGLIGGSTWKE